MDNLKMHTPDKADRNFDALAALFPNAVTETIVGYESVLDENGKQVIGLDGHPKERAIVERAIDKDVLAQEINAHVIEGKEERYQFTWPDKKKSVLLANTPIAATLRPCRKESVNFDTTENLYIEGDNLDVLKLLQETYLNRVKMIYIDPPYNTGNDFVYEDDFAGEADDFLIRDGQYDDDGNRMVRNLDSNGRFHTDWLNMIYPRLRLARDLLKDDGAIFISIDDNEINNLRKMCDEIFGVDNFIAQIIVQTNPRGRTFDRFIAKTHEYIVVYSKSIEFDALREIPKDDKAIAGYQKEDFAGKFRLLELRNRNPVFNRTNRPLMFYPFYADPEKFDVSLTPTARHKIEIFPRNSEGIDGCWTWGLEKATNEIQLLVANLANTGKWSVFRKDYLEGTSLFTKAKGLWLEKEMNHENGKEMIRALFSVTPFDFPKSVEYIKKCLLLSTAQYSQDVILDFFSGSATTAHAVMQLNAEDGGKRKFIMVQLPEVCEPDSEAAKAGYKNICEIGKERIRRAGVKVVSDKWLVISKDKELLKNYGCKELPRSDCLAESNGSVQAGLFAGKEVTEGRDIFAVRSDETGGSVDSIEHSGGAGSQFDQGISSVSGDSEGFKSRTGNTASALCESGIPCRYGYYGSDESVTGSGKNDGCPHKLTNHCSLTTTHFPDIGFRVLKLDSTNMKDVYYTPQEIVQRDFDGLVDNIKSDRTPEDLLFQVMLDLGVPLSAKIEKRGKVFYVNNNYLVACFEPVDETLVAEIAQAKPYYAVFRDSSFKNDSTLVNFEQLFRTYSPTTIRKVL